MTREDLSRHSDQMRQFLMDQQEGKSSTAPLLARSPSTEDMRSFSRSTSRHSYSRSRGNSLSTRDASPPRTPIKAEFSESPLMSRQMDTMEAVIERQQQARKERKLRKGKEREPSARRPTSPSPTLVTTRPQSRLQVTPQASRLNLLARGSTSVSLSSTRLESAFFYLMFIIVTSLPSSPHTSAEQILSRAYCINITYSTLSSSLLIHPLMRM